MPVPDNCVEQHSKPVFELAEALSVVIFDNPDLLLVHQIQIDGCVFKSEDGKKCDWLINVNGLNKSIFVELKGSLMDEAYFQLQQTHQRLEDVLKKHKVWIISYSGSPRFNTSEQTLIETARIDHRVRLIVRKSPYTHPL